MSDEFFFILVEPCWVVKFRMVKSFRVDDFHEGNACFAIWGVNRWNVNGDDGFADFTWSVVEKCVVEANVLNVGRVIDGDM